MKGARCGLTKMKSTTPTSWMWVSRTYLCSLDTVFCTSFCHSMALVVLEGVTLTTNMCLNE